MADATHKFLDPDVLNKITRLDLKARHIVEGFVAGMHKSPYHGFSVEFAKHREYTAGDDIKHLDWKVFGRSDRLSSQGDELEIVAGKSQRRRETTLLCASGLR